MGMGMSMGNTGRSERILQCIVAVLSLVPIAAGIGGVVLGPAFLGVKRPWPVDLDSHLRFLSGTFLIVGLAWLSCAPRIGMKTGRVRLLAVLTFAGGLSRLYSASLVGFPSAGYCVGLGLELVVVPILVAWQARIASGASGRMRDRP